MLFRSLVGQPGSAASPLGGYLDALSRLRARLDQIGRQGDPGPAARALMQQTLGGGAELAAALKHVDQHMLAGMSEPQRQALRPILVGPLLHSFAMIVGASEADLNKAWQVQVLDPFQKSLRDKFPFTQGAQAEASAPEIGLVFGPRGAIADFVHGAMGALVVRRGNTLAARTWADMGLHLRPHALADYPRWVAPIEPGLTGSPLAADDKHDKHDKHDKRGKRTLFQGLRLPPHIVGRPLRNPTDLRTEVAAVARSAP